MLSLVLISALLCGDDPLASTKEVTVEGVADITNGEAAAREAAIRNAQRHAVEEVLGSYIQTNFSAEQKEIASNNQSSFSSQVQDQIMTKSSGFIETQKVVSEKRDGSMYRVTLTAAVRVSSLKAQIDALQTLLKSADYPKVIVLVGERYKNQQGTVQWIDRPAVVPEIEEALLKRTFELVAKDVAERTRNDAGKLEPLLQSDAQMAALGAKNGADVVVTGISDVTFSAFNEFNDNMYYVSARINLRAINASSGKVMSSFEHVGRSAGVSEDLARVKAVQDATPEAADKLLAGMVQVWKQEAAQGRRFHLTVMKVKNYGKQARPLLKAVQGLAQVTEAREVGYHGQQLEIDVIFKGKKQELLDGIFDHISTQKAFRKLDKVSDEGDTIALSL